MGRRALQLLCAFCAVIATVLPAVSAAKTISATTYVETFEDAAYKDAAHTTAVWDTGAGQVRLPAPAPRSEQVLGQLYHGTVWSAAVYVPDSERVYVFGGSGAGDAIQTYDPATNTMVKLPVSLPSSMIGSAAVYVASRRAIYLFGGAGRDVVIFRLDQQTTSVMQDRLPVALSYASAVYVPSQDRAYVFGGLSDEGSSLGTILQYDLAASTAITLPASLPVPAHMTSAIYDPQTQSAYIFGGKWQDFVLSSVVRFDVVDGAVSTAGSLPDPCSSTSAIYVPEQRKAYVFGGDRSVGQPLEQVVEFDIASASAITLDVELPTGRSGTAAAYVASRGTAYILGGLEGIQLVSDVLAFDAERQAVADLTVGIDGRAGASGVYEPARGKVYLFGGRSGRERASHSIVTFDLNQQTMNALSATLPVSRTETAAVYDATAQQAHIFGGLQPIGPLTDRYFDDILSFDAATESISLSAARLPTARADMSAVFVTQQKKAYLFGGVGEAGSLDEILVYDAAQDTVTLLDERLPTAAAGMAAMYEATVGNLGTVYLFGGWAYGEDGSSVTYYDQVVAFDIAAQTATALPARLPQPMADAAVVPIPGEGAVYVVGGALPTGGLRGIYRFDPRAGTVALVPDLQLAEGRAGEVAVYVADRATAYLFGGYGGRLQSLSSIDLLEFAYPLSATAQSLKVSQPGEQVHEALLHAQQSLRGGTVSYSLSNNGGQTWSPVYPGIKHEFPTAGSDLRWRAVLSGNGRTTPIVDSLSITYDHIVQYRLFLPVVLRAYHP